MVHLIWYRGHYIKVKVTEAGRYWGGAYVFLVCFFWRCHIVNYRPNKRVYFVKSGTLLQFQIEHEIFTQLYQVFSFSQTNQILRILNQIHCIKNSVDKQLLKRTFQCRTDSNNCSLRWTETLKFILMFYLTRKDNSSRKLPTFYRLLSVADF